MKKALLLVIGLLTVVMVAQEKSSITVQESTVATGVVVVTWDLNGKSVDLQCTQSMPACTRLKTGKIRHGATAQESRSVRLPERRPIPCGQQDTTSARRVGEYCLNQKLRDAVAKTRAVSAGSSDEPQGRAELRELRVDYRPVSNLFFSRLARLLRWFYAPSEDCPPPPGGL